MVEDYTKLKVLGSTQDDAAGECLDKAARVMGLDYPGGVNLDKVASVAVNKKYPLPTPKLSGESDFSFSGLKTAVINLIHNANQKGEEIDVPVLCATLRQKVCDILIEKTINAAKRQNVKQIALAGGVSANSELRSRLVEECKKNGFEFYCPELKYCSDNAAMVGVQGYYEYLSGNVSDVSLNATATLEIDYNCK
jgi:N6-L-threonylcarbamoyladenine synthase